MTAVDGEGRVSELVISRPAWRYVWIFAAVVAAMVVPTVALAVVASPVVLVLMALPLGIAIAAVAAARSARNGTATLGPAGITMKVYTFDRQPQLVPWPDVRAVWVARDGRFDYLYVLPFDLDRWLAGRRPQQVEVLRVMASRSGTPMMVYLPSGLNTHEQVLDAVRELSGGTVEVLSRRPDPEEAPERELRPVEPRTLRPTLRLLVPAALFGAAGVALVTAGWRLSVVSAVMTGVLLVAVALVLALRPLARLRIDSVGPAFGLLTRTKLTWSSITAVEVFQLGPWRSVWVRTGVPAHRLPAPSSWPLAGDPDFDARLGLVADAWAAQGGTGEVTRAHRLGWIRLIALTPLLVALVMMVGMPLVLFDKPWQRPYWPGVHLATATPDPCAAVPAPLREPLVGTAPAQPDGYGRDAEDAGRDCRYRTDAGAMLDVVYDREDSRLDDPADEAAEDFESMTRIYVADMASRPVRDVGDEAVLGSGGQARRTDVVLLARRANVVVRVSYSGGLDAPTAEAAVVAAARAAVGAVRLS